jgi:diguanylate cyclase (GGDEF)-like protein
MTPSDVARRAMIGLVVVGRDGEVEWLNDAARALVEPYGGGWTGPASALGALRELRSGARRVPVRWSSPQGDTRWWQAACTVLDPVTGDLLYEISDETDRYDADGRDLGPPTAQWRLSRLEAMAGMGSYVWNVLTDRISWSEALLRRFRLLPHTEMDLAGYLARLHPDDVALTRSVVERALADRQPFTYTHRLLIDGAERWFECYGEVFCTPAGTPTRVLGTARDVTEQHRDRQELAYLADHDPLTGIANRRRIGARLAECARAAGCALLLIDIDNFKDTNDLLGHGVGDQVICQVARTIAVRLGPDALLGRLGGDEFAVVVPDRDPTRALELAERLCDAVATTPMVAGLTAQHVTASIGVTTVDPGQDVDAALAQVDLALYAAKKAGRNRMRLFTVEHYDQAVRRVSLLQRVCDGLEQGRIELDAQPIVDLTTGRAGRHEVLIRLRDGLDPPVGPSEFLPAAERTDLVLQLDRWVLDRAIGALAASPPESGLRLEVNVSARSLEDDELGSWILDLLKEAEVAPHRLGLEITETTAISSLDAARLLAARLTDAGCGFALDDFGAGFGSFSYLKHLPFTTVKIAGEFVCRLDEDPVDRALVAAVVGVAQQLGMRTVAEHVDRPELVDRLRELGVDDGQGYHLGRPRPLALLLAASS